MLNFNDVNEYFDFLCKHKLTPEQFAFLYTLVLDEKDEQGLFVFHADVKGNVMRASANIYRYASALGGWKVNEIKDLEERDFIRNFNRSQGSTTESIPDNFEVNDSFKKLLIEPPLKVGEELWREYPDFIVVNGKNVRAKTCDKDYIIKKYHRIIQGSLKRHKKVMETLRQDKSNHAINMGIQKYVESRQWEATMNLAEEKQQASSYNEQNEL